MHIKLTIYRKGLILVTVPMLFQLALIGAFTEMQRQVAEASYWFAHTKEVLAKAETVLAKLVDPETGSRVTRSQGIGAGRPPHPVPNNPIIHAIIISSHYCQVMETRGWVESVVGPGDAFVGRSQHAASNPKPFWRDWWTCKPSFVRAGRFFTEPYSVNR